MSCETFNNSSLPFTPYHLRPFINRLFECIDYVPIKEILTFNLVIYSRESKKNVKILILSSYLI